MARAIWKGHISFGLVNIPVNLHAAEQRADLSFHMLDSRNHARVRYERVNAETGEEVPWSDVVSGYEFSDGNYVIVDEKELKKAAPEVTKRIEIEAFVGHDEIDFVFFDKPYFLEPAKHGEKGYVLLREALKDSGRVGIARVVIRTRQYVSALVPRGDVLVLDLLRYAQEIRSADALDIPRGKSAAFGVTAQELKVARTLVDSMASKWEPEKYHDEYRDTLIKWIERKAKSGETQQAAEPERGDEEIPATLNFMELLKKSVKQGGAAATANGRSAARGGGRGPRAAARKSTAASRSGPRRKKAS